MMKRVISVLRMVWQVFWPVLVLEAVSFVVSLFLYPSLNLQILTILTDLLAFGLLYPVYRKKWLSAHDMFDRTEQAPRHFRIKDALFLAVFAAVSCFLLNELILLSGIDNLSSQYQETNEILYSGGIISQLLLMAAAAPLAEELIFRGLCYGQLRKHIGAFAAGFFSALWFGVFHGNLVQGIYGFSIGLLLALIYEKYGGLRASMWFHACANLTSILLTRLMGAVPEMFTPIAIIAAVVLSAVVMLLCIRSALKIGAIKKT